MCFNWSLGMDTAHFGITTRGIFPTICSSVSSRRAQCQAAKR